MKLIDNNEFKIIHSRAIYSRQKNNTNTDYLKRILFLKYELTKITIKALLLNKYTKYSTKLFSSIFLKKYSNFAFNTKFINYCVIRGRKYSVSYKYKLSRYVIFKNLQNIKFLKN